MKFENASPTKNPIENVAHGATGEIADTPMARHLERIGWIKVLDRKAASPGPADVTPEAMAALLNERDGLRQTVQTLKDENARLQKANGELTDSLAMAKSAPPAPADPESKPKTK